MRCGLCGLLRHLNSFNPEDYDDDIVVVDMRSLGRGRGFEKTAEYSALGDEVLMGRISKRLKRLLHLIEGDSPNPLQVENVRLDDQVEELEDDVKVFRSELKVAKKRIRELEEGDTERYDELLYMVNEALGDGFDEVFTDLGSATEALLEAYDDLLEEVEDED